MRSEVDLFRVDVRVDVRLVLARAAALAFGRRPGVSATARPGLFRGAFVFVSGLSKEVIRGQAGHWLVETGACLGTLAAAISPGATISPVTAVTSAAGTATGARRLTRRAASPLGATRDAGVGELAPLASPRAACAFDTDHSVAGAAAKEAAAAAFVQYDELHFVPAGAELGEGPVKGVFDGFAACFG
jgi:hypothetical protein